MSSDNNKSLKDKKKLKSIIILSIIIVTTTLTVIFFSYVARPIWTLIAAACLAAPFVISLIEHEKPFSVKTHPYSFAPAFSFLYWVSGDILTLQSL